MGELRRVEGETGVEVEVEWEGGEPLLCIKAKEIRPKCVWLENC